VAVATFALMTAVAGGVAAAHLAAPAPLALAVLQAQEQTPVAGVQDESSATAARTDGFDPATCHPQPRLPTAPAVEAPGPGAQATVLLTVMVPPTTRIVVDDLSRPIAVSTNTGQAPCVTDQFLRLAPDGTPSPADQELSTAVLRVQLGDDWRPGVPQPLAAR
jgi:hypothetical protein